MMILPKKIAGILHVEAQQHSLEVQYETGEVLVINLEAWIAQAKQEGGTWLAELDNTRLFEQVKVTPTGALEWANGLDLCPDALFQAFAQQRAA